MLNGAKTRKFSRDLASLGLQAFWPPQVLYIELIFLNRIRGFIAPIFFPGARPPEFSWRASLGFLELIS